MTVHQIAGRGAARFDEARLLLREEHASRATIRRRQVVLALSVVTVAAFLAALGSGGTPAWWAVAAVVAVDVCYLGALHRSRRLAAEREFQSMHGGVTSDIGALAAGSLALSPERGDESAPAAPATRVLAGASPWAVVRFCGSYAAGWALAPVVFSLTLLVRQTPRDTTGQRWLANLQAAQERLREQSLRTIAVSATTASMTAAGTVVAFSGASPASAATVTASAPPLAAAPLPAAAPPMSTYRVVNGDTLWGIAARFGTTITELASANHISDPNLIFPGQALRVPRGHTDVGVARAPRQDGTYTVREGDTLWSIAARFDTTVSVLAATNNIANPNVIVPGEVLVVRGGTATAPRRSATRPGGTHTRTRPTTRRHPAQPAPRHPSPPPAAPESAAQVAVQVALAQVGKPYQWAGAGPSSFDCSGLVMYAWEHAGVDLPHYSVSQYQDTTRVSGSELRPGDLVFYDTGDGAQPGHVTLYLGDGRVVTADSPGTDVRVESLTWDGVPMGFGRVR